MLKAIDGTKSRKRAPAPTRGLIKAVYETVDALGGPCTEDQILQMLPAAVDDSSMIGKGRVHACVLNAVWRGYLIYRDDRYSVAPLAYWEARQRAIEEMPKRKRKPKASVESDNALAINQAMRRGLIIGLLAGFAIGFSTGGLLALMFI